MSTNILAVEDNEAYRLALAQLLRGEASDLELVASATTAAEAVAIVTSRDGIRVDVTLMDVMLPGVSGIEATRAIVAVQPSTLVVGLSITDDPAVVAAMLGAGARGYVLKDDAPRELAKAIHIVQLGGLYLSSGITAVGPWKRQISKPPA